MRPKSMATVVVVLPVEWVASSIPMLAEVIAASVRRGSISDTAPTNVVLPTPKPPATTSLAEIGRRLATMAGCAGERTGLRVKDGSDGTDTGDQPPDECNVVRRGRGADLDVPGHDEVTHEHAGDTNGNGQLHGDLGDGDRAAAGFEDGVLLAAETAAVDTVLGHDERLDGEVGADRAGAPAGQQERAEGAAVDLFGVVLVA